MIYGRALIKSIEKTRTIIESMDAQFKSNYILKDIIFVPTKENYNLNDDFVRVRINIKSDWPGKRVILVRKQTEFKKTGKVAKLIIKQEFDTKAEALPLSNRKLLNFKRVLNMKEKAGSIN